MNQTIPMSFENSSLQLNEADYLSESGNTRLTIPDLIRDDLLFLYASRLQKQIECWENEGGRSIPA